MAYPNDARDPGMLVAIVVATGGILRFPFIDRAEFRVGCLAVMASLAAGLLIYDLLYRSGASEGAVLGLIIWNFHPVIYGQTAFTISTSVLVLSIIAGGRLLLKRSSGNSENWIRFASRAGLLFLVLMSVGIMLRQGVVPVLTTFAVHTKDALETLIRGSGLLTLRGAFFLLLISVISSWRYVRHFFLKRYRQIFSAGVLFFAAGVLTSRDIVPLLVWLFFVCFALQHVLDRFPSVKRLSGYGYLYLSFVLLFLAPNNLVQQRINEWQAAGEMERLLKSWKPAGIDVLPGWQDPVSGL